MQILVEAASFEKLSLLKNAANAMCATAEIRKSYCTFATTLLKLWKYLNREDITEEMRKKKDALEAIYKELQKKRKHADITDLSVAINDIINEHVEIDDTHLMLADSGRRYDIGGIDFDLCGANLPSGRTRTSYLETFRTCFRNIWPDCFRQIHRESTSSKSIRKSSRHTTRSRIALR